MKVDFTVSQAIALRASLICCLLDLTGCGTVRISRPDHWRPATDPRRPWVAPNDAFTYSSPATAPVKRTIWITCWGINQQNVDPANCSADGLAEVKVSTNLGYSCISVLSVGFFMPVTVEWRCAKPIPSPTKDF